MLELTEIKIYPTHEDKLKAYVSFVINGAFVVRDVKIIEASGRVFVSMPSRRMKDGTFKDIVHPLNAETRALIEKKLLDTYLAQITIEERENA